jgi:hypothetical protein
LNPASKSRRSAIVAYFAYGQTTETSRATNKRAKLILDIAIGQAESGASSA